MAGRMPLKDGIYQNYCNSHDDCQGTKCAETPFLDELPALYRCQALTLEAGGIILFVMVVMVMMMVCFFCHFLFYFFVMSMICLVL